MVRQGKTTTKLVEKESKTLSMETTAKNRRLLKKLWNGIATVIAG